MLFQRVNREDAERVFSIVYNIAGATVTAGYPVVLDVTAPDGVRVSKPATATLSLLLGLAVADITDSSYGKIQVYGYKASGWVYPNQTTAIAAGDILIPVDSSWHLTRSSAGNGLSGLIMAAESYATMTTSITAQKKVFIRAL